MQATPLVSVIITSYNREDFIKEAIDSVLASSYKNIEVIIVDDCSTDSTYEIAKEYQQKHRNIKLFRNKENIGQFENRNKAATYSEGKYLKFVDSDDAIFPDGIQYCVEEMEKYPEASLGLLYLNNKNLKDSKVMSSENVIRNHFFDLSILGIGPSGTIFRKQEFDNCKGFDVRFDLAADNYLNIKMAALAPVVLLPKVFFKYRMHEGQVFNQKKMIIYSYLYNKELYLNGNLPLTKEELNYLLQKLEKRHFANMVKYLFDSKSIADVFQIIKSSKFKWWNVYRYIFY